VVEAQQRKRKHPIQHALPTSLPKIYFLGPSSALLALSRALQLRAATKGRFRFASVDSPSSSPPAPSSVSDVEGDRLNRRRSPVPLYIATYILRLGLVVAPVSWSSLLLLLRSTVGGGRRGRSAIVVRNSAAPTFGDASWRIKVELGRSWLLCVLDPVVFFFSPSLIFVGVCLVKFLGMLVYQLWISGWLLDPTVSGGLHLLLDVFCTGVLGSMLFVASDLFYTGEEMVVDHLARPVRSTSTRHVGFPDVLLLVPFQIFRATSSGRWSASGRLLRPPVTRMTGSSLQGLVCNFLFIQRCLCKVCNVNYQKSL
jgi:hypothetical protein